MKQDRFLTGILIGIAVLIVVALAVFFMRKDNLVYVADDNPAGVVQNYIVAVHKHDYDKAYTYLAEVDNKPTLEQFRQSFLSHYISPDNVGLELGKVEINGKNAAVEVVVIYNAGDPFSSGYRNAEYAQVLSQNGVWKIRSLPAAFWAYDWYQPTPQPVK